MVLTQPQMVHSREKPVPAGSAAGPSAGACLSFQHCRLTRARLFRCQECHKAFGHRSQLIAHQWSHTGKKPHQRPRCGEAFSHKWHPSSTRQHTWEKPYECKVCGKAFKSCRSFVQHQKLYPVETKATQGDAQDLLPALARAPVLLQLLPPLAFAHTVVVPASSP
ncbi:Zinc finger protein 621 [Lemmus lemmus]